MTLRLLVIDDDAAAILAIVAKTGLEARCETTGSASEFDCVLLGKSLEHVRALAGAPILYFVDHPTDDLEATAIDAGAFDVLPRDVTPKRLATRVRLAIRFGRAELNAAHLRDEILKALSHDLRTPLHAIGLACDGLRDQLNAEGLRYLGAIDRAGERIERMLTEA